jgi:hypothetical protein
VKSLDLHRSATAEMIEAARFYERRRHGVGFRFILWAVRIESEPCQAFRTTSCTESKRSVPKLEAFGLLFAGVEEHDAK